MPVGDLAALLEQQRAHPETRGSERWSFEVRQCRSSRSRLGPVCRRRGHCPCAQPPASLPHGPASPLRQLEPFAPVHCVPLGKSLL